MFLSLVAMIKSNASRWEVGLLFDVYEEKGDGRTKGQSFAD